jgi:hypothetical protein
VNGDSFKLEYKPRIGETLRYTISVNYEQFIKEHGIDIEQRYAIEMLMAQKILEVDEREGHFSSEYRIESGTMKSDDAEMPLPGVGEHYVVTMRMNGEMISTSLPLPFTPPSFPREQLHFGDTWSHRSALQLPFEMKVTDSSTEQLTIEYEFELREIEEIFDRECLVIEVKCPEKTITIEPDFSQTIEGYGKVYFDHNQGILHSFNNRTYNQIKTGEGETELSVTTTMDLA